MALYPIIGEARSNYPKLIKIEEPELKAIQDKNWMAYAKSNTKWYQKVYGLHKEQSGDIISYDERYGDLFKYPKGLERTGEKEALRTIKVNQALIKDKLASKDTIQETTGWQRLGASIGSAVPLFMLLAISLWAADIITKDRKHLTLVNNFPLSIQWRLLIKNGIVLMTAIIAMAISFLAILFISGDSLGSPQLPAMIFSNGRNNPAFTTITTGHYLLMWILLALMIAWFIIRLSNILALIFKNQWIILVLLALLLISERAYFQLDMGAGISLNETNPYQWLPISYFKIGDAVLGDQNFLYGFNMINWKQGIITMAVWIVGAEAVLQAIIGRKSYKFK
jgi:hypothetical protein